MEIVINKEFQDVTMNFMTYHCQSFRQNGENGFHQGGENLIPQLFNISMWIGLKNLFKTIS